jgi:hypothetical protein
MRMCASERLHGVLHVHVEWTRCLAGLDAHGDSGPRKRDAPCGLGAVVGGEGIYWTPSSICTLPVRHAATAAGSSGPWSGVRDAPFLYLLNVRRRPGRQQPVVHTGVAPRHRAVQRSTLIIRRLTQQAAAEKAGEVLHDGLHGHVALKRCYM